jgi:fatty acyl-CoA reductase
MATTVRLTGHHMSFYTLLSLLFLLQLFAKHGQETKSKVVAIHGDISQPGLALSEEDSHILTNNVSVVFHAAATISFNASLQSAINTNLVGTKRILQLCHHMPKIKVRGYGCI